MTTIHRRRGVRAILLAALVGATFAASAAAADPPPPVPAPTSDGSVGAHHLVDTAGSPGARCLYANSLDAPYDYLTHVHVEPPVARARSGHASQRIGFRYVIKGWNGTTFKNVFVSDFQVRTATPTTHAAFTGRTAAVAAYDPDPNAPRRNPYRVRVDLRWYSSSGKVVGSSSDWVDWYTFHQPHATDLVEEGGCYANLG